MISTSSFVTKGIAVIHSFVLFRTVLFVHKKILFQHGLLMPDTIKDRESLLFNHYQSQLVM